MMTDLGAFFAMFLPAGIAFVAAAAAALAGLVLRDDADRTDWPREDWR